MTLTLKESMGEAERMIEGQAIAERLLRGLNRSMPRGDELFNALMEISESGDSAQLRGFARTFQKALEGIYDR